jgi:two-component system cell cycle sensor histidine kinase/response regulator CckA
VRTDGDVLWIQSHGHVLKDGDGVPVRVIEIVQDITERKRLQEQYLHAQKMESVGRLAGGIAHDFNNLLTAILGFVELAETAPPGDPSHQAYLKHIKSASYRAADLVKQLLAFARKQILTPRVLALNTLVADLGAVLQRLIGDSILLRLRETSDLWPVYADPGQIEQVIINLVVNARDAMPQGGTLTIETRNVTLPESPPHPETPPSGDYVRLSVQDTGVGMSAEVQKRIFEPFFTTKEVGKGTGLGLATSYGIVRQNKGYIQVNSELNKGTEVVLLLPRQRSQ